MTALNDSVIRFLRTLPRDKKRFCALTLLRSIALEASEGDPILTIGMLDCAKQDFHDALGSPAHTSIGESYEELTN